MNISQLSVISPLNPGDVSNYSLVKIVNDTEMRHEITRFIQNLNYWLLIVECLMVFFGICGNLLALVVINRRSLRDTSSSVFITYLAVFDSSVLLVHLTSLISSRFVRSTTLHCLLAYLTDFVTFSSIWIMVIMTIERCIAVHSPFSAKRLCTIQRARHSIYILIVIDFLLCTVSFPFIYTVDESQRKCGVRKQYQTILRIVKPTIFYFIPDIILLINLFIIYELFIARRQRANTLVNPENAVHQIDAVTFNRKQLQLTVMLVTVSLSFYLFTTPAIIDYIRQRNPPTYRDVKRLKMRFLRTNFTVLWLQMSSAVSVNQEISPSWPFSFRRTSYSTVWRVRSSARRVSKPSSISINTSDIKSVVVVFVDEEIPPPCKRIATTVSKCTTDLDITTDINARQCPISRPTHTNWVNRSNDGVAMRLPLVNWAVGECRVPSGMETKFEIGILCKYVR